MQGRLWTGDSKDLIKAIRGSYLTKQGSHVQSIKHSRKQSNLIEGHLIVGNAALDNIIAA